MNYPFTHLKIGKIIGDLTYTILPDNIRLVEGNWITRSITCKQITDWASQYTGYIQEPPHLSLGTTCNFHIDNTEDFGYYHLAHRIIIPLTDNFQWEFILKDGTVEIVKPEINTIYMFNNMITHRFVSDEHRACVVFDMYDKDLAEQLLPMRPQVYINHGIKQ